MKNKSRFWIAIVLFNLSIIPLVTAALFNTNSAVLFRISVLAALTVFNVFFLRMINREPAGEVSAGRKTDSVLRLVFLLAAIVLGYSFYNRPLGMLDAFSFWNFTAKYYTLSFLASEPFSLFPAEKVHPHYPAFVPLTISFMNVMAGHWHEFWSQFYNAVLYLVLAMIIREASHRRSGWFNLFLAVVLLLHPMMVAQASNLSADMAVSVFLLGALYLLDHRLTNQDMLSSQLLTGLSLASLLNLKTEGALLFFNLMVFVIFSSDYMKKKHFWAGLFPGLLFFAWFKMIALPYPGMEPLWIIEQLSNPVRYFAAFKTLAVYLFLILASLPFFVFYHFYRQKIFPGNVMVLVIVLHFEYFLLFVIGKPDHLNHMAVLIGMPRVMLQLFPAFILASISAAPSHEEAANGQVIFR